MSIIEILIKSSNLKEDNTPWLSKSTIRKILLISKGPKQNTVCPGSSDPPEKILNISASDN